MPVNVIPDEGERLRPDEISEKSSKLTYLKKDADTDTSACNRVLNALKKLYKLYNPTTKKIQETFIEGN